MLVNVKHFDTTLNLSVSRIIVAFFSLAKDFQAVDTLNVSIMVSKSGGFKMGKMNWIIGNNFSDLISNP